MTVANPPPQLSEESDKKKNFNTGTPPPSEAPPTYEEQAAADDEQFFVDIPPLHFNDVGSAASETVDKDRCILHLKLLAALADLRATISSIDGLFGIYDSQADKFAEEATKRNALIRIREKRWAVYTARAADRYTDWWLKCVPSSGEPITWSYTKSGHYATVTRAPPIIWTAKQLPPLDVLMVWHAHMLNPRAYLEDCLRGTKMSFWCTDFPWQLVDVAIDSNTFDYDPGEEAVHHFTQSTGRSWDNLDDPEYKQLNCLLCSSPFTVPWTTGEIGPSPESAFEDCTGYADKGFMVSCNNANCTFTHSNQTLRVARFHQDVKDLLNNDRPMPGTYLNMDGITGITGLYDFPNTLIKATNRLVLDCTEPDGSCNSMLGVKTLIESLLGDHSLVQRINGRRGLRLTRGQKIPIRRMMSRYWENSSIFALDLVGAVIRQGTFIQKMDNIDWIHSPAVSATMDRLLRKYKIFFNIMISHPGQMAVPTLDVDLAWHTHQMSPYRYCTYSRSQSLRCGPQVFIDHDDKVDEGKLSDAFEWTSKQYKKVTNGELYSECTCWYCEATRESFLYPTLSIPSSSTRRARTLAESLHDDPRISSEPDKNPHISAHNAVHIENKVYGGPGSTRDKIKIMRLRQMWEKSNRRAQKRRGKQQGGDNRRNRSNDPMVDPYYPMIYGYPYYMPFYAPYMADPCISSGAYPSNPACMNAAPGSYGNCAAGTCGSGVASGACAGAGGGGCGGGACGGGGGGGCGGGGGGGGGGCGGGGGGGGGGGCGGGGGG